MTWLAPWALGAGVLGLCGVVIAHLLARQRPRALSLATARFLAPGMLEATTVQPVPQDRWWLLLRLLIVALVSLAVAQPVITGTRVPSRTVLLLDRMLPADAQRSVIATLAPSDVVISYDTIASLGIASTTTVTQSSRASLGAAIGRLVRARDSLTLSAEALRIVVASPFAAGTIDPATRAIRALLQDTIVVLPIQVATDSSSVRGALSVHSTGDDPVAATVLLLGDSAARRSAVLQRAEVVSAADSQAARRGTTVVHWPATIVRGTPALQAITVNGSTWIAPLQRPDTAAAKVGGQPVGWWADGKPAIWRSDVGAGCILTLHVTLPDAGDHTLSLSAQAFVRALVTQCDVAPMRVLAPPAWLSPAPSRLTMAGTAPLQSALAPWLLGAGLVLAVGEMLLRTVRRA